MSEFPVKDEVILASAGSGKTFALSDRIIKLLSYQQLREGKITPQQIVALTFTRAAAGEFIAKTLEKLAGAASEEAAATKLTKRLKLPEKCDQCFYRNLLRATLLSMHRLTLGTLDSFFAKLVANNPTEVGLDGGQIRTISDVEAAEIRTQVIAKMMEEASPEAVAELWTELRNLNQGKEVATPLKGFDETVRTLHDLLSLAKDERTWGEQGVIWPVLPEILSIPGEEEVAVAATEMTAWLEGWTRNKPSEVAFKNSLIKQFRSAASAEKSGDLEDAIFDQLAGRLRPVVLSDGRTEHQVKYGNLTERFIFPPNICRAVRILARKTYGLSIRDKLAQTKAAYRLLARYEEIYNQEVRQKGRLTFTDNVTLLLNAEGKFNIDYRLDCEVKHWLFDEFQDTSTRQYKVLENNIDEIIGKHAIRTEWRTVFFVGDLKQSLYGWRAGNPELLRQQDANIPKKGNNRLDYTRRCAQPVVDLLNDLLGDLSEHGPFFSADAASQWANVWGDHTSQNEKQPEIGEALWVRLSNLETEEEEGDEEGDPEDAETSKIASQANWIGAHIRESGLLAEHGLLQPGITCAILVSKNKQAAEITEVLRRMKIEAADEAAAEIAMDNPFTAGIVSLIKNTAHPTDRLSEGMAWMSPSAKAYVDRAGGWEEARFRIAGRFYEQGGEALLQDILQGCMPGGATNAERFLAKRVQQVLALAVKFDEDGQRDLGAFATHLETSSLRDTADPRSVQVLTIHRSKGLQYTAVYLPCLNSDKQKIAEVRIKDPMIKTDSEFNPTWILTRPKTTVCEADPETLHATLTDERTAAAYENLCRLYVGMTRAIRRLVLVTDELKPETKAALRDPKMHRKYDFAMLLEAALDSAERSQTPKKILELKEACKATIMASYGSADWVKHAIKPAQASAAAANLDLSQLVPVKRTERLRPSKSASSFQGGWSPDKGEARGKAFGTIVHELFNHLEWDAKAFRAGLAAQTWSVESPALYDEAVAAIEACLKSAPVAALLLSKPAGSILWNERKATLMHEGKAISAVFDRVHVIPGQSATVIDYKTNDCSLEHLKEIYQGQMDLYRVAVAKLCGLSPDKVRCVLIHVRLGQLVEC